MVVNLYVTRDLKPNTSLSLVKPYYYLPYKCSLPLPRKRNVSQCLSSVHHSFHRLSEAQRLAESRKRTVPLACVRVTVLSFIVPFNPSLMTTGVAHAEIHSWLSITFSLSLYIHGNACFR